MPWTRDRVPNVTACRSPALGRRPHITVFGDGYDTPDGACIRDYIHVTDFADAHVRALERGALGGACNPGNGQGFPVQEVIARAGVLTGRDIQVVLGSRRTGSRPRLVGDASRAYAELDRSLATAWEWHRCRWG